MNDVLPDTDVLARRLVLFETPYPDSVDAAVDAGERAWSRLEQRLTALIGAAGFAALSARALALARPQHPVLAGFTFGDVQGERLTSLREHARAHAPTEATDALVGLMTHFLAVFIRLIGVDLVVRLIRQAWPELPSEDVELSLETHE